MPEQQEQVKTFPKYVTDGSHIYLWHPEYERLYEAGTLRDSGPPEPPKVKTLSHREQTKLNELRAKALKEAQDQVRLLEHAQASGKDFFDIFGAEPKEEIKINKLPTDLDK